MRTCQFWLVRLSLGAAFCLAAGVLSGCPFNQNRRVVEERIHFTALTSLANSSLGQTSMATVAARNETIGFALTLAASEQDASLAIRLRRPRVSGADAAIDPRAFTAYQILPLPANPNRAGFVRHTGQSAAARLMPRALLPLKIDGGLIRLASLRRIDNHYELWIDLNIPTSARPGTYNSAIDLVDPETNDLISSAGLSVEVFDFALPNERHLSMVSRLNWTDLVRLWPGEFDGLTPRLMNRTDPRYAAGISKLDQLMTLSQAHRLNMVISRLQPSVKWPGGSSPLADWKDFDSLVGPWLTGTAFADKSPLGYWPLPEPEYLNNFDIASRAAYWRVAASHFDQNDWLERSSVFMAPPAPGRLSAGDPILLSAEVGTVLRAHPRVRVTAALELDQIQLATPAAPNLIPSELAARVQASAAPLVSNMLTRTWPDSLPRPSAWLRTDMPGLTPTVGLASTEADVRLWAFLANLRSAGMIDWPSPLPAGAADSLVGDEDFSWFYPGEWFGIQGVLPSVQLKWLRRCEQDAEYLWLLRQYPDEALRSMILSRLVCKPVELSANQPPDPTYALFTGTGQSTVWFELQKLLAESIELHQLPKAKGTNQAEGLKIAMARWRQAQDRPLLIARSVDWLWDTLTSGPIGNFADVRLGLDVYDPAPDTPNTNTLAWSALPPGWLVHPQPQVLPSLGQFKVRRVNIQGRVNLDKLAAGSRQPIELTFTNGFTGRTSTLRMLLPIANSFRRESRLSIDGSLEDWDPDDALQEGPMVQMLSATAVQEQSPRAASTPASVYTNWSDENFYVGFKLEGVQQTQVKSMRNFVNYDLRRAWGEDLVEVLIQPIYIDNTTGPVLHLVCKPGGQWIERRLDPRGHVDPWQPVEGAAVRYAGTLDGSTWRGEMAIPWRVIHDRAKGHANLLRFNVIQHKNATGESSSWAGPIDFGRDDAFMGLLHLREPNTPGMK